MRDRERANGRAVRALLLCALVALAAGGGGSAADASRAVEAVPTKTAASPPRVRAWTIHYRAHNGARRGATVLLPAWYGPKKNPRIPLVISPHGRGVSGRVNARNWGRLPARGEFAVVSPDGHGRKLRRHSWGYSGQIDDLARMPVIVQRTLPWLRIDHRRIYAVGGSMGGQETLLLLARYPKLLAGAAVFDAVVDLTLQYRRFRLLACNKACKRQWTEPIGDGLQDLAQEEIGGTPRTRPTAYRIRSPITYARAIAHSCVPLQIWWSVSDRIVGAEERQSRRLFTRIRELNPRSPVTAFVGYWRHTAVMQAQRRLPLALVGLQLLYEPVELFHSRLYTVLPPESATWCGRGRKATSRG